MYFWDYTKKIENYRKKLSKNLLTISKIGGILDELSLETDFGKQLKKLFKKV